MNTVASYLKVSGDFSRETLSLLSYVCKRDTSWILSHTEYQLSRAQITKFNSLLKRLSTGEPLAYLRGYQDFYNYRFNVSPSVLIPRPESEIIIEAGLSFAQAQAPAVFIDIGTGSGALILSLAAEIKRKLPRLFKTCDFMAGDISSPALNVARNNAAKLGLSKKVFFKRGDLFLPFVKTASKESRPLFIAANLPYLTPKEARTEISIAHEPKTALLGGRDGLSLYRRLLKQMRAVKTHPIYLIMEINPQQETALMRCASACFHKSKIKKVSDLTGRTRFISILNN